MQVRDEGKRLGRSPVAPATGSFSMSYQHSNQPSDRHTPLDHSIYVGDTAIPHRQALWNPVSGRMWRDCQHLPSIPPGPEDLTPNRPTHSCQRLPHRDLRHSRNPPGPGLPTNELVIQTSQCHQTHPRPRFPFLKAPSGQFSTTHLPRHFPTHKRDTWTGHSRKLCRATR